MWGERWESGLTSPGIKLHRVIKHIIHADSSSQREFKKTYLQMHRLAFCCSTFKTVYKDGDNGGIDRCIKGWRRID